MAWLDCGGKFSTFLLLSRLRERLGLSQKSEEVLQDCLRHFFLFIHSLSAFPHSQTGPFGRLRVGGLAELTAGLRGLCEGSPGPQLSLVIVDDVAAFFLFPAPDGSRPVRILPPVPRSDEGRI